MYHPKPRERRNKKRPLNRYLARTSLNQDLARTNKKNFLKLFLSKKKGPLGPIYLMDS